MSDELLTVEQAAERLQMHPDTVRRLLREGRVPGRKVGVRQWRVSAAALATFIEGGGTQPAETSASAATATPAASAEASGRDGRKQPAPKKKAAEKTRKKSKQ